MAIAHDIQEQISKIDQQIIGLLEQRILLCAEAARDEEDALEPEDMSDAVGEWEAAADERGWDIGLLGRLGRLVVELCRSTQG